MYQWSDQYQWYFSKAGIGDSVGINDTGIGMFKRQPYKGLIKEVLQNAIDAKDPNLINQEPVKVEFKLVYVDVLEIPGYEKLRDVIHRCHQYYPNADDGEKLEILDKAAEKYLEFPAIVPVLKISDYNTTGLTGVHAKKGTNWTGLVRERGATNKSNAASGANGVGKFAPFNFSSLRTVLYNTQTIDGETAFQGKTILTTFEDENGQIMQNVGLFAEKNGDSFDPIFDEKVLPDVFQRTENGTDVFVLGFKKDDDWIEQSVLSVLENFFYAIYKGNLEVEISGEKVSKKINKNNLADLIAEYNAYYQNSVKEDEDKFEFTAPMYWEALNNPKHQVIKKPFIYKRKNMGDYELYLLTGSELNEKRALEMRQAGMKIKEDLGFRIPLNFIAIFIATGEGAESERPEDNISSFLRKCEPQAHDDWAADVYEQEKDDARKVIKQIHTIILDAVREKLPKISDEEIDAFGLNKFLPNIENDAGEYEEQAFSDYKPLSVDLVVKKGKVKRVPDISMKKKNGGSKTKRKRKEPTIPQKEPTNPNPNNQQHKSKVVGVVLDQVKTPYDARQKRYCICFQPKEKCKNLHVTIRFGNDDDAKKASAEIAGALMDQQELEVKDDVITVGACNKNEKKILTVSLKEKRRRALEVLAYDER